MLNAIPRAWWWWDFLTTPRLEFASLSQTGGTVERLMANIFDPTISFADLDVIREMWPGKLVIKGVQNVADARALADLGVDGIVLSNHGGRQLDRAPVPFHLLPDVVKAVGGRTEVTIDTGIMNGADIVASLALGAQFTLVGRAYLYGLMAGGRDGVDRAIDILRDPGRPHHAAAAGLQRRRAQSRPRHPAPPPGAGPVTRRRANSVRSRCVRRALVWKARG